MKKQEDLKCLVTALNFSPKGGVEGLQVEVDGDFAQIVFPHDSGTEIARAITIGLTLDLVVEIEPRSEKPEVSHPVYQFISMKPLVASTTGVAPSHRLIAGIVARLNYARHGEANGIVLASGDFIHLKPDGMKQIVVSVGDHIEASGKFREMDLGGHVIEATTINGVLLKGKH